MVRGPNSVERGGGMVVSQAFQVHLRELWSAVEPFWRKTVDHDVPRYRRLLDAHLGETPRAGEAMLLADRLHALIDAHEHSDPERQQVVCTAVRYFLETEDAWDDRTAGGLTDDQRVVRAAEIAVAP